MATLDIHVLDSGIVVNLVGTRCTITFERSRSSRELIENPFWTYVDQKGPMSASEFRALARLAADNKAKELGWLRD